MQEGRADLGNLGSKSFLAEALGVSFDRAYSFTPGSHEVDARCHQYVEQSLQDLDALYTESNLGRRLVDRTGSCWGHPARSDSRHVARHELVRPAEHAENQIGLDAPNENLAPVKLGLWTQVALGIESSRSWGDCSTYWWQRHPPGGGARGRNSSPDGNNPGPPPKTIWTRGLQGQQRLSCIGRK